MSFSVQHWPQLARPLCSLWDLPLAASQGHAGRATRWAGREPTTPLRGTPGWSSIVSSTVSRTDASHQPQHRPLCSPDRWL